MSGAENDRTLDLVNRARLGDDEAFEALYRLYESRLAEAVHRQIGIALRSEMETADVIQSVWKDVLSDMQGFEYRGQDSFLRWLLIRTIRKIQDKGRYFAAQKRTPLHEGTASEAGAHGPLPSDPLSTDPSPSRAAIQEEELECLMRVLGRLADEQRRIVIWHLRDGVPLKEIGRRLGRPAGTVRQIYRRALKQISNSLPLT
ncbi:MAG: sigma-70 family RNA polymerase sigma factor [Planctomycetota bacterium]